MRDRTCVCNYVINFDDFLEMPLETQALYFHLLLRADDDGYIVNPKAILRETRSKESSLTLLTAKGYIQYTEEGYYYISDWDIHMDQEDV